MYMPHEVQTNEARDRRADLSRRRIFKQAGWAMIAAACRPWLGLAADQVSLAMTKLSGYMAEARTRALPEEVIEKTKHHLLDTIASMVSGSELPPGKAAIQFARAYGGEKIAPEVVSTRLCATT